MRAICDVACLTTEHLTWQMIAMLRPCWNQVITILHLASVTRSDKPQMRLGTFNT